MEANNDKRRRYDVVVFDVDGTLIPGVSAWEKLHQSFGTINEREFHKKKFFNNEMSIEEWVEADVELWKRRGVTKDDIVKIFSSVKPFKNVDKLIKALKSCGYKIAIVSGSIDIYVDVVLGDLKKYFDFVYINKIKFDENGKITSVEVNHFDYEKKLDAVIEICQKLDIGLDRVVFIGDGINDIKVMKKCGFGIAINPDDDLKKIADVSLDIADSDEILKYLCD